MKNPLRDKRLDAGLTQVQIAEKTGMTERGYRRYEAGNGEKTIQTAIKIAKALNTTVEELWGSSSQNIYN